MRVGTLIFASAALALAVPVVGQDEIGGRRGFDLERRFQDGDILDIASNGNPGNGARSGAHYNLNIHGVENGGNATMTGSNRHTIFVALGGDGTSVRSKIYLTQGEFRVCDGNAFDAAYDCSGQQIQSQGAVFQLPCNTNLSTDGVDLVPCEEGESAAYEVYARALGTPGGSATITTCATDPSTGEEICSSENVVLVRNRGRQMFRNVTDALTSLVAQLDDDQRLERVALFAGDLEDWFWAYDNNGLRLAQIRFYLFD